MKLAEDRNYRTDIDALRAIAVLAVIACHCGYLSSGFLGVDVFFVISGFLITGIIYNQIVSNKLSVTDFYLRRIRRILPLSLFVCLMALAAGVATMLPDDLENLSESVIATNVFGNNILQAVTTRNYWDVVNHYKPLMHTWSLGVEEQYYLLYPLFLIAIMKKRPAWALPMLSIGAVVSFVLFASPYYENYIKFYQLPFRFWELAAGGIAAIALNNKVVEHRYTVLPVALLVFLLCIPHSFISPGITLLLVVLLTTGILASSNGKNRLSSFILENKLLVAIGKISFSLYMWHQVLLAYARYCWTQHLGVTQLMVILLLTFVLSVLSYFLIEQPFRDRRKISTRLLLLSVGFVFLLTMSASFFIYINAGVLKDIPELGIHKTDTVRNMHARYNSRVLGYDKDFRSTDKIKVLIIGNSFARDWANVLFESKFATNLEISYISEPGQHKYLPSRAKEADVIFYSTPEWRDVRLYGIPGDKLWVVGTKNFGTSNGIFYRNSGSADYFHQRTTLEPGFLEKNNMLRKEWGERYVDFIGKVIDDRQTVPVFTPSNQFISHDCRHLTQAGARYFGLLFEDELAAIFNKKP